MRIFQNPAIKKLVSKCTSITHKLKQQPIWENISSKCKNISICQASLRQMGVLVLLVFFLTSVMVQNIQAASLDAIPNTLSAQKVLLNGKESGYVCDQVSAEIIMDEILDEAAARFNMEIADSNVLRFEETTILREDLSTKEELEGSLRKYAKIFVNAYTIYADDVSIGVLQSEEEAQQILNNVKSQYLSDEGSLDDAKFQEDVKILATPVISTQVQAMEEVVAELEKKQDTVEEYTLKGDDTFWSISQEYKIKMDDLVKMNEDKDPKKLRDGMVIRLSYPKNILNVVTKELTKYEERIPYETETQTDDSMYTNESKVIREGQEGKRVVEANIIRVNGVEKDREVISEDVVLKPVNKIVAKGTKKEVTAASIARGHGKFKWPTNGRITSRYGQRWGRLHKGVDIANSKGTPVYAAESGKVSAAGRLGGYGNRIEIDHGAGVTTLYAHLSSIKVSSGTSVSRGQLIGYMGNTGNSTGPHLHFEVRINGSARNPLKYLN